MQREIRERYWDSFLVSASWLLALSQILTLLTLMGISPEVRIWPLDHCWLQQHSVSPSPAGVSGCWHHRNWAHSTWTPASASQLVQNSSSAVISKACGVERRQRATQWQCYRRESQQEAAGPGVWRHWRRDQNPSGYNLLSSTCRKH